jgi:NitT/TauT family transport system permease protein
MPAHRVDRVGRRRLIFLLQGALLAAVIGIWETASSQGWIDPFFFSQPSVFV